MPDTIAYLAIAMTSSLLLVGVVALVFEGIAWFARWLWDYHQRQDQHGRNS